MIRQISIIAVLTSLVFLSCDFQKNSKIETKTFRGAENEVKLMTLAPGHFHAGLVQKVSYNQVSPNAYVYAPFGPEVYDHLQRVHDYNLREENPTNWTERVYLGEDFLEKMLNEKPGNVMITAGNNRRKTEYIKAAVDGGVNVLADKPMCVNKNGFELLKKAFQSAEESNVLLYDIMTERSEITTLLQKEFSKIPEVFGEILQGSPDNPSVTKESVHHFFKYVSGKPLTRPAWFFDIDQQGQALADVGTHLVDLVQWEVYTGEILDYQNDIEVLSTRIWPTNLNIKEFERVTGLSDYPAFLEEDLDGEENLDVYANGETIYRLKNIHAKVSVEWKYQAPPGAGDTHYSIMRGTKANLIIRQGQEQEFVPQLYIEPTQVGSKEQIENGIEQAVRELQNSYQGINYIETAEGWQVLIPEELRVGHEAHFGQVMERYLHYLTDGKLPEWEIPNMLAKYYTTTTALEMAEILE